MEKQDSRELNPAEENRPPPEVPTPEQQTGNAPSPPDTDQNLAPRFSDEENPANPPSERG